jgi:hypothetical protein
LIVGKKVKIGRKTGIKMNVKEHVINSQKVRFSFYRDGILYYKTDKGLLFEVPISDTGSACFNGEDRAMLYMRWIRKQLEANEEGMKDSK